MAATHDQVKRRIGGLTVTIDRGLCVATQSCIHIAPEVFRLGDDMIVAFREGSLPATERERLIEACASCPVAALIVVDESGRQIVPP